jgi:hypothetical protein
LLFLFLLLQFLFRFDLPCPQELVEVGLTHPVAALELYRLELAKLDVATNGERTDAQHLRHFVGAQKLTFQCQAIPRCVLLDLATFYNILARLSISYGTSDYPSLTVEKTKQVLGAKGRGPLRGRMKAKAGELTWVFSNLRNRVRKAKFHLGNYRLKTTLGKGVMDVGCEGAWHFKMERVDHSKLSRSV